MKSWFTRITRSRRGAITLSAFTASVVAMIALSYATWSASALNANLRVDPSTQTVGPGAEFTVSVIHNADVQLTGFQANLHFDQTKLELLGIEPGTEWGSASLYYGIVPQTPTEAFAYANANGVLPNIARFKGPGEGKIEPGPKVGAIVRFRAKADASDGEFPLTLDGLQALDANFSNIPASKTDGAVIVSSAPTSTATSTATATQPATSTSTITPTVVGVDTATATPTASSTPPATSTPTPGQSVTGIVFVSPALQSVEQGTGFTLLIKHNVQGATTGIAAEVAFDPELVQIVDVQPGTPYLGADLTVGTGQAKAEAIAEANVSGTLAMSLDLGDGSVSAGDADAFRLIMQAKLGADGVSPIELTSATVSADVRVLVTRVDGLVEVVGAGTPTATPTAAVTATATATAPASSTPTATPAALTPTATATRTNTPVPTPTATKTATATATVPATATATTTVSALSSSTATGTATNTPAPTNTTTSASATATSSSTATRTTVAGSATAVPTVDPATAQGTISLTPPTITVPPGAEFTLILVQQASFATTGAETDVKFDPALLKVVSVEKSQAYSKASLLAGVAPEKLPDAIASANASGTLKNVATFFVPGSGSIPAGQEEFVRIKMQANASASNTTTAVKLADLEMLNEAGEPLTVAAKDGQITIQSGAAVPTPPGASSTVAGNAVAGTSASPSKLPSAGTSTPYGELNWALTISLIAVLASGGALVGSLARAESDE